MDSIYKMMNGTHIDLSKIIAIVYPEYVNSPKGYGDELWYGFKIHCQLRDEPLIIHNKSRWRDTDDSTDHLLISWYDDIVSKWKEYNGNS